MTKVMWDECPLYWTVTLDFLKLDNKECVEDPIANGLSLTDQILYIKWLEGPQPLFI